MGKHSFTSIDRHHARFWREQQKAVAKLLEDDFLIREALLDIEDEARRQVPIACRKSFEAAMLAARERVQRTIERLEDVDEGPKRLFGARQRRYARQSRKRAENPLDPLILEILRRSPDMPAKELQRLLESDLYFEERREADLKLPLTGMAQRRSRILKKHIRPA
ncbi:hypothetical protein [Ralstonia thomasii]|jgi:hypothetical protein